MSTVTTLLLWLFLAPAGTTTAPPKARLEGPFEGGVFHVRGMARGHLVFATGKRASQLAFVGQEGEPRLVDAHSKPITDISTSSKADIVVTGSEDGTVKVWSVPGGAPAARQLTLSGTRVTAVAIERSNTDRIAVGTSQGAVLLWNRKTGEQSPLGQVGDDVTALTWSADGAFLVAGAWDGRIWVFEPRKRSAPTKLGSHTQAVSGLSFSDRRDTLYSASHDGSIRRWKIDGGASRTLVAYNAAIRALQFDAAHPDQLVLALSDNRIVLLRSLDDNPVRETELAAHSLAATSLTAFRVDGKDVIVSGSWDGMYALHEVRPQRVAGSGDSGGSAKVKPDRPAEDRTPKKPAAAECTVPDKNNRVKVAENFRKRNQFGRCVEALDRRAEECGGFESLPRAVRDLYEQCKAGK